MELVRVVTKNFVYALGFRLPVPPGYLEEPFIATSMSLLESEPQQGQGESSGATQEETSTDKVSDDDGGVFEPTTIRIVCYPDMDAATSDPQSPEPEDEQTEEQRIAYEALASYHAKARQAAQDHLLMIIDVPISEDTRMEYITTEAEYAESNRVEETNQE